MAEATKKKKNEKEKEHQKTTRRKKKMMMHNKAFSLVMFLVCLFPALDAAIGNDWDSLVFAYFMTGIAVYFVWEGSAGPVVTREFLPKTSSYYKEASAEELRTTLRNICEISETESEIRHRVKKLGCPHEPFVHWSDGVRVLAMFPTTGKNKNMVIASASKGHHAVPVMLEKQWLAWQREYQSRAPILLRY